MSGVIRVAVPTPVHGAFDYLPPASGPSPVIGGRVRVSFGRRRLIGLVVGAAAKAAVDTARLRPIDEVIDDTPLLGPDLRELLEWTARYYHHALGETVATALPVLLRRGEPARRPAAIHWRLSSEGRRVLADAPPRAARQRQLLEQLAAAPDGYPESALRSLLPRATPVLARLTEQGLIEHCDPPAQPPEPRPGPALTADQARALDTINSAPDGFAVTLLQGVTGSGKTEVYLQLLQATLQRGQQALVLVPEIGLTPQLVARFGDRVGGRLILLHSGMTAVQRLEGWLAARAGGPAIVLGTRSAVFTPMPDLGLIVIDEEHDASFKQQDGLRYSARDVAIRRAQQANVPIVLGSATPALETMHNVLAGRYRQARLATRATGASAPAIQLLDVRSRPLEEGLSRPLLARVHEHVEAGGQALLFVNRRGFAPAMICHDCGWIAPCRRCDTGMTLHRGGRHLRCHHCGAARPAPPQCEGCGGETLIAVGEGTERVAAALRSRLPAARIARFDRDTTARRGSLERMLASVAAGTTDVLVGTQMLAKGHDFPNLTFVGVINADHGLFSADFRAFERMAQLVTQVAGRAGRGERPGEVLLQTRHPDHPLLGTLVRSGYDAFANAALAERESAGLPPYGHLALVQAEAPDADAPTRFLAAASGLASPAAGDAVAIWGPAPAPLERRAGRFRAHLLIHAASRAPLHRFLRAWLPAAGGLREARRVRWSVDVDPQELI